MSSPVTLFTDMSEIERAIERVNIVALIDASGRSGNVFFLTLFDRHPEVSCCPIVQYTYSYILSAFGDATVIDAAKAHEFVTKVSYFRLLYNDPVGEVGELITRMGAEVGASIERAMIRRLVDDFFGSRKSVTRRELVLAPLVVYAASRGMDLDRLRYVLVGDAISLREESVVRGFSGRIVDVITADFPDARLVRLVRDPRATFASPRHQFVNALGNMYAITPSTYFRRLWSLLTADLRMDNACVYLYWLLYLRQAGRAMARQLAKHRSRFLTIRNEDLNTDFVRTMRKLSAWLGIERVGDWQSDGFSPTIAGAPWAGIGAYNSRYQRVKDGLLPNDADEIAQRVTGPNVYVTQRWRSRLNKREVELIEHLFRAEIEELAYEVLYDDPRRSDLGCLLRTSLLPFEGELPTPAWLRNGLKRGAAEFLRRLFYALTFPPFYVISRILLAEFVLRRRLFRIAD